MLLIVPSLEVGGNGNIFFRRHTFALFAGRFFGENQVVKTKPSGSELTQSQRRLEGILRWRKIGSNPICFLHMNREGSVQEPFQNFFLCDWKWKLWLTGLNVKC